MSEEPNLTRLNKYLSEVGYCSRRAADELIAQSKVYVNGAPAVMGTKVAPNDEVKVDGILISKPASDHVYIALNKPVGIVCTTDVAAEKNNIIDFINHPKRIFHIGRLDKPSEGLILLTSDGDIVNKILRAKNYHQKEYIVSVNRSINADFIYKMANGIPVLDTITEKCKVTMVNKNTFNIVLTQGLNRQIRRMCQYLGYEVVSLKRVRIMNILLDMPVGKWRDLRPPELEELLALVANSSKTFD